MNSQPALRVGLETDLLGFTQLLRRLHIPHRVTEERDAQVVWVTDPGLVDEVRNLYARYPQGDTAGEISDVRPAVTRPGLKEQLRASPVTAGVLLITLIVAAITLLGDRYEAVRWLTFLDFRLYDTYIEFYPVSYTLEQNQWWRFVSPMFLHFGVLHLAMNSLWYWELGRRIEFRQKGWMLLALTFLFSLAANLVQYWWSGPALFGGLSGVLYGLLGHCWLFQLLAPTPAYRMPKGVVIMMLAWLGICLTGAIDVLGFGAIANGAHVGGLLAGCVTGVLGGLIARTRR
ncbi:MULTISPECIES: rhomboid family intramembrane serine protease [Pseudomonas]|uniref:Rhomboid family intramembrane serine protease n=1 Tax=Pseudomonas luteola TaxID=47886 RepID=A0ABS0FHQ7_PSELU|nr:MULTISPECIES: rhomboid family intramembrane serine protease [Pseudomonas]MBF8639875.1 rhomboid family intramembrane serine protease [Pseudomonas zeshuii]RRW41771.1 rhomboid family intramembrane serine protease [Pseudomonas luteola]SHI30639.1 GlpG protein [Pseudomonas zeshuii]